MPMMQLFDKQIQLRMGQANVQALDRRPPAAASPTTTTRSASTTSPPTGCRSTRRPHAYEMFQKKEDGAIKVVFRP